MGDRPSKGSQPSEPAAPGFGRESRAAAEEPRLRSAGDAATAWWRAEGGSCGWCSLRAATAAGVKHRLSAAAGEDSYAWAVGDGVLAAAVADGVGSVAGAARAAERAAAAAAGAAVASGTRDGVEAANREAEGGGATTVVVAVVDRRGRVSAARVGDSTAFVAGPGGRWRELFEPPDPERPDGATAALPAADPHLEQVDDQLGPGEVLVLASDGLADPWRDGPTTVAPSFAGSVVSHPSPLELAGLVDFSRHGCHDDRTAVCVWLPGVGEGVDAGAAQSLHLDDVAASGDEPGDEDRQGGEEAPPHAGADDQHQEQVGGEHAAVGEADDDER
jgi:serine/threonine protein phosphatase PrpC